MNDGKRLARAAAGMIGAPFRLYGRDPKLGIDCVGLVAASMEAIGHPATAPANYRLRNSSIEHLLGFAQLSGFEPATGEVERGDVILTSPGPGQHHLLIAENSRSAIHAHAGLRRVVRQPLDIGSQTIARWRPTSSAEKE